MAHRRSGAQRRALQKQAQRARAEAETASDDGACVPEETPQSQAPAPKNGKPPALTPEAHEVIAAVASLYMDELKPFGRLLRKRLAERYATNKGEAANDSALPDVDVQHLRSVCEACTQLDLQPEEAGDWSVTLIGCVAKFIDVYSHDDPYSEDMWVQAADYFENADKDEMTLPGGRYSCAQALLSRGLSFLQGRTLGAVCHIVQLAISQKKQLGYLNGSVVSYSRSQSMMKEKCAAQGSALAPSQEAVDLPFATWDTARTCLRKVLEDAAVEKEQRGPGMIPLSNVKRAFRSTFQLELSETMLGHSKLSELLQDDRFVDICFVRLDGHGYTVVQTNGSQYSTPSPPARVQQSAADDSLSLEPRKLSFSFCPDSPLCLDDACEPTLDQPVWGPTPGLFGSTPCASPYPGPRSPYPPGLAATLPMPATTQHDPLFLARFLSSVRETEPLDIGLNNQVQPKEINFCPEEPLDICFGNEATPKANNFCPDEPLCLDDAICEMPDMLTFGQTPCPFGPTPTLPMPPAFDLPPLPPLPLMPLPGYDWSSYPWPYDPILASMVQNTFIHAAPAPPTPLPSTVRRFASVPPGAQTQSDEDRYVDSLLKAAMEGRSLPSAQSGSTTDCGSSSSEESTHGVDAEQPVMKLSLADHLALF